MIIGQGELGSLSSWESYGFAGLVTGALFVTLYVLGRFALDKFDRIAERHEKNHREMDDNHRSERREWREEATRREEVMSAIARDFSALVQRERGQHGED